MLLFNDVIDAIIAAKKPDSGTVSRLDFWREALGEREVEAITPEDMDDAMVRLAKRGRLKGSGSNTRSIATTRTKKPLADSTMNRYLTEAQSVFKFAKKRKLVSRRFVSPAAGMSRQPEPANPDRYIRPEDFARLLPLAKVLDKRWRKMAQLMTVAFHTGMRVSSILNLRGKDFDRQQRTVTCGRTKNGAPIYAALSDDAFDAIKSLPKVQPDELIFGNRYGRKFVYRSLWNKIAAAANLEGRVFHELRHGHGFMLAKAGTSQQLIMKCMGHKTLRASERYAHANVNDKREVIARVFANVGSTPPKSPTPGRPRLSVVRNAA